MPSSSIQLAREVSPAQELQRRNRHTEQVQVLTLILPRQLNSFSTFYTLILILKLGFKKKRKTRMGKERNLQTKHFLVLPNLDLTIHNHKQLIIYFTYGLSL